MATGYTGAFDDRPKHRSHPVAPATWAEYAAGDGAQASTVGDMAAYLGLLLNRGRRADRPPDQRRELRFDDRRSVWTGGDYYGYGLATYDVEGRPYIGHGGGNTGFRSAMIVDMRRGPWLRVAPQSMGRHRTDGGGGAADAEGGSKLDGGLSASTLSQADPASVPNAVDYAGTSPFWQTGFSTLQLKDGKLLLRYDGEIMALEGRSPGQPFTCRIPTSSLRCSNSAARRAGSSRRSTAATGTRQAVAAVRLPGGVGRLCRSLPRAEARSCRTSASPCAKTRSYCSTRGATSNRWSRCEPGLFRVGEDACSPETLRFTAIADGQALRADYSGCPYYRTFRPSSQTSCSSSRGLVQPRSASARSSSKKP